jgi:hypothetical protein
MNKAELRMLEKLFAAEVESALSGQELRGIVQSKSKLLTKLESEGYVKRVRRELKGDRFGPIVVEGWQLTLAGNAAYCFSV